MPPLRGVGDGGHGTDSVTGVEDHVRRSIGRVPDPVNLLEIGRRLEVRLPG
jgi:hypothetical protein